MSLKNRVKLNIGGSEYVVVSDESEEYVVSIGQRVDNAIREKLSASPHLSITAAAVLTALDFCDEWQKASASQDNLRLQMKNYLEDNTKAKVEIEEARREIGKLKREIYELRQRLINR